MRPSIEDAKRLQGSLDLRDTHLVWLDESGFTIAHTDHERHMAGRGQMWRLDDCDLYDWLQGVDERPVDANGWYTVDITRPRPWNARRGARYQVKPLYGQGYCGSI